jgi:1,4-dihydroxy-2-naphthoate octaprenyltransferase
LAAIPLGALATGILVVNNLRDRETDARVGKRTLAVRFGRRGALAEYFLLIFSAYALPGLLLAFDYAGPWVLLPWLTAPVAFLLLRRVSVSHGRALNPLLVGTARLLFVFGVLFALGIALGARAT